MLLGIRQEFYQENLAKLKHKNKKVAYILEHFPKARSNDNYLCMIYWKLVDDVKRIDDIETATKAEVIRRARQKIQNQEGKFKPDVKVRKSGGLS